MSDESKKTNVEIITTDNVHLDSIWDFCREMRKELRTKLIKALAYQMARKDHLAEILGQPKRRRKRVLNPSKRDTN